MPVYAVTALILSDTNKVLSVSRKDDHEDFNLPGGKLDPGETPAEAIVRELEEETGLTGLTLTPFYDRLDKTGMRCWTYILEERIPEDEVTVGFKEGEAVVAWKEWSDITGTNTYALYNQNLKSYLDLLEESYNKVAWIDGPPPSGEYSKVYWLKMYDQGGWPFIEVAHIRAEHAEGFDPKSKEKVQLVTWIRIPGLGVDKPLKDIWNITAHRKIEKPEL
jgi:ADP-ribose pyrophosphatase YjhB (NUDIX family)